MIKNCFSDVFNINDFIAFLFYSVVNNILGRAILCFVYVIGDLLQVVGLKMVSAN